MKYKQRSCILFDKIESILHFLGPRSCF